MEEHRTFLLVRWFALGAAAALAVGCLGSTPGRVGGVSDAAGDTACGAPPLCDNQAGVCDGSLATRCEDASWLACDDDAYRAHNQRYDPEERCDGYDNNCDGQTDEGFHIGEPCDMENLPVCRLGVMECGSESASRCVAGPPRPDGIACSDACVAAGTCVAGSCEGPTMDCDDGDACTDDRCDPVQGCVHDPLMVYGCCDLTLDRVGGILVAGRGTVEDVEVRDDVAYVAEGRLGFHTVDVSDPDEPRPMAWIDTAGDSVALELHGDLALLADSWSPSGENTALYTIDVSDPANPLVLGSYGPLWLVKGLARVGEVALVAEYDSGVRLVDVSDPAAPVELSFLDVDETTGIWADGERVFVLTTGCATASMLEIDVSDPLAPQPLDAAPTFCFPHGLHVDAGVAWVSDYGRVHAFDVTTFGSPTSLTQHDVTAGWRVRARDGYVYTAGQSGSLRIFEISGVAGLQYRASSSMGSACAALTLAEDFAYVGLRPETGGGMAGGFQVVDIGTPASPSKRGKYSVSGQGLDVAVSGNRAYVAEGDAGLRIYDVSAPTAPVLLSRLDTPDWVERVRVQDELVYLVQNPFDDYDNPSLLTIVDPGDGSDAQVLGTAEVMGSDANLVVAGQRVYVTAWRDYPKPDYPGGLFVFDTSDVFAPIQLGHVEIGDYASAADVSGDFVYVAAKHLQVVDVSDPTNPTLRGATEAFLAGGAVQVVGDLAYATNRGSSGPLQAIDISDPDAPVVVGEAEFDGMVDDLTVYEDYVLLANTYHGVTAWDIFDPTAPTQVAAGRTVEAALGLDIQGSFVFVADGRGGLQVLELGCAPGQ